VSDPHAAVACDRRVQPLNLVAAEAAQHQQRLVELSREHPDRLLREVRGFITEPELPLFQDDNEMLRMPAHHSLEERDLQPDSLKKVLLRTYETQATRFEDLLGTQGIGATALRSLSLIAELIYQTPASRRDPAAYSFAHGGKDGHPYPVNRRLYDANLERLREVIAAAKIGSNDKVEALKSLARFVARLR
jgi:hypothetical protein